MKKEAFCAQDDFRKMAKELLSTADRHQTNGELTLTEMEAYLPGSPFEAFYQWLKGTGKTFGGFDKNRSFKDRGTHCMPYNQNSNLNEPNPNLQSNYDSDSKPHSTMEVHWTSMKSPGR